MNAQKIGPVLAAVTLMALVGTTSVCRAASPAFASKTQAAMMTTTDVPTKLTLPQPPFVMQIGDAMLEEYTGGDPAGRTELLRGGSAAQTISAKPISAKRSGASHS